MIKVGLRFPNGKKHIAEASDVDTWQEAMSLAKAQTAPGTTVLVLVPQIEAEPIHA